MKKICILTFEKNPIAVELFSTLNKEHEVFVIYTKDINSSVRQIWIRKKGLRWFLYNIIFNIAAKLYKVGHNPRPSWKEVKNRYPKLFIEIDNHNSLFNQKRLKQLDISLGVLIGTPLIRPEVFRIPRLGMINLHQGNIPRYRGGPPAFWEHRNKEIEMNITVHAVDESLDAGPVLEEERFPIKDHEHFVISKFYANSLSGKLLKRAIEKVFDGTSGEKREIATRPNTVPGYPLLFRESMALGKKFLLKKICSGKEL